MLTMRVIAVEGIVPPAGARCRETTPRRLYAEALPTEGNIARLERPGFYLMSLIKIEKLV